jgi:elongation factor P--(R)-beta-lysine ligase
VRTWQPSASIDALKYRAKILTKIREFFALKDILEVETPVLFPHTVTDPFIQSLQTSCVYSGKLYMQTSPEYAMKRLLVAGSGSIYQICKSFRDDDCGKHHNPEFSMLEWYLVNADLNDLMDSMDEFLQFILNWQKPARFSYQDIFLKVLDLNPHRATLQELTNCASQHNIPDIDGVDRHDRDLWLQLLMSCVIEPNLKDMGIAYIYNYPKTQAALAKKVVIDNAEVAQRFEVYINGVELANGFFELCDANEQLHRFKIDQEKRHHLGLPKIDIDQNFIAALKHGLPKCAGVALGIDRLIMAAYGAESIKDIMSFTLSP